MSHAPMFSISSLPALWEPQYGATLKVAFWRFFKKYVAFEGRASRSEFWWVQLVFGVYGIVMTAISFVVSFALVSACGLVQPCVAPGSAGLTALQGLLSTVTGVIALGTLLPSLGLLFRRLHDTNRSAHYLWMYFIPIAGPILVLVFTVRKSVPAGARFDRAPYSDAVSHPQTGVLQS